MAVLPHPPLVPGVTSDKVQHILAFATLSGLLAWAYPRADFVRAGLYLSLFGAVIECFQLIPGLNRDGDPMDWVADTLAAATLIVAALWRSHRARRRT
jgi:hypothetical protein